MPPRLQLLKRAQVTLPVATAYQPIAPFLYPCLQQQRSASILNSLSDTPGAYNKRIRVGRGPSSGKGKTSGRGHKGQKQHGKVPVGFQGGQTPNWVVHGKRGFTNKFTTDINPVNLDTIQLWINKGRIDPSKPITIKELTRSKCVNGVKDGVKLLARGKTELTSSINIVVSRASEEAIEAVEKLGGTVTSRFYTEFAVKKIKAGEMDPIHSLQSRIEIPGASPPPAQAALGGTRLDRSKYLYRLPDPTSRKDFEYYRDSTKRGYLSHTVAAGHGPSLFFKNPAAPPTGSARKVGNRANRLTKQQQEATRLW